jgi:hypothetical protein
MEKKVDQKPPESPRKPAISRREALEVLKKTAVYTPPAIATILLLSRGKANASPL